MEEKFIPYGAHSITEEDVVEVLKVLKSNWITTGPKIEEFEKKFCDYIGCKYSVAVCNGTAALDLAVNVLNLKQGSEIITTPFTFVADANCILYNGLKPVFADIRKDTYNINPSEIQKKITDKTKAIIYVDYAGQPCDIEQLKEIADDYGLFLIEDACHALGAKLNGEKIGNFADITVFSFHPVKHITTGEGGMLTTNNKEFANKLRILRNHGIQKDIMKMHTKEAGWEYDMKYLGRNYRLTDFQCALGISQLKRIDSIIEKRSSIAKKYNEAFSDIKEITIPFIKPDIRHAWHLYTILLNNVKRDGVFRLMKEQNIGVNVHYIPVYRHSYYKNNFKFNPKDYPVTEDIFSRIITLPLHPRMEDKDINSVVSSAKESLSDLNAD